MTVVVRCCGFSTVCNSAVDILSLSQPVLVLVPKGKPLFTDPIHIQIIRNFTWTTLMLLWNALWCWWTNWVCVKYWFSKDISKNETLLTLMSFQTFCKHGKKAKCVVVHTEKINGVQCGLDHNNLQNISQMKEMHTGLGWHRMSNRILIFNQTIPIKSITSASVFIA